MDNKVPTSLLTSNLNAIMQVKHEAGCIAHAQQILGTKTAVVQKKPRRQNVPNSRVYNIRNKAGRRGGRRGREKMDLILC